MPIGFLCALCVSEVSNPYPASFNGSGFAHRRFMETEPLES